MPFSPSDMHSSPTCCTLSVPQSVMVLDGVPPLEELAKYNSGAQPESDSNTGGDLSSLMAALPTDGSSRPKAKFAKGDKVGLFTGGAAGDTVG